MHSFIFECPMVLSFAAFVQPDHRTTMLLTAKGDFVSLSGHMTLINKTFWPLFPSPGPLHRNRYLGFAWREGV